MLIIRKEQMRVFAEYMKKNFEDRMVEYLRESYPEHVGLTSVSDLRTLIRSGINKAASYGIEIEYDVGRFIGLMLKHGLEFDRQPWAAAILSVMAGGSERALDQLEVRGAHLKE